MAFDNTINTYNAYAASAPVQLMTNEEFVADAYAKLLGLEGDFTNSTARKEYWVAKLEDGSLTKETFAAQFLLEASTIQGTLVSDTDFAHNQTVTAAIEAADATNLDMDAIAAVVDTVEVPDVEVPADTSMLTAALTDLSDAQTAELNHLAEVVVELENYDDTEAALAAASGDPTVLRSDLVAYTGDNVTLTTNDNAYGDAINALNDTFNKSGSANNDYVTTTITGEGTETKAIQDSIISAAQTAISNSLDTATSNANVAKAGLADKVNTYYQATVTADEATTDYGTTETSVLSSFDGYQEGTTTTVGVLADAKVTTSLSVANTPLTSFEIYGDNTSGSEADLLASVDVATGEVTLSNGAAAASEAVQTALKSEAADLFNAYKASNTADAAVKSALKSINEADTNQVSNSADYNSGLATSSAAESLFNVLEDKDAFEAALTEFLDIRAAVETDEANQAAVTSATEAITDTEEDGGLGLVIKDYGTDDAAISTDDVFIFDEGTDATIANFGTDTIDYLYLGGEFNLVQLAEGESISDNVGSINDKEVFWEQSGANVILYVESETFAGNMGDQSEITQVTLTGVASDDINFSNGTISIDGTEVA